MNIIVIWFTPKLLSFLYKEKFSKFFFCRTGVHIKSLISIFIIFSSIFSQEYAEFDIITNNNPFPGNIFIHTQVSNYMAILDEDLAPYWYVKSDNIGGIDFKENNGLLTYFNKDESYWVIVDSQMNEIDTVMCTEGQVTDYHDNRRTGNDT